jgi:arsenate reductase
MIRILFLCTGNTCRSQIAEGLANHLGAGKVAAFSAGVAPGGRVMADAVAAMAELGVDISAQYPKHADEFVGQEFDFIVTLCDNAKESCPYFPGKATHLHWPIADPYGRGLAAYQVARDEIKGRLEKLFAEYSK